MCVCVCVCVLVTNLLLLLLLLLALCCAVPKGGHLCLDAYYACCRTTSGTSIMVYDYSSTSMFILRDFMTNHSKIRKSSKNKLTTHNSTTHNDIGNYNFK